MRSKILLGMAMAFATALLPCAASASLGGDLSSVHDDQMKMQGSLRMTNKSSYNVHEITASNGIVVREFVSLSGNVFGIAWQGPSHPDLQQVLGANYDQFTQAVKAQRAQRRGHGPLVIQQPGLVVQMSGHMHSLMGMAYLPQSLPRASAPR
jgi:hypothetical protein